jgi:hypothetical protein
MLSVPIRDEIARNVVLYRTGIAKSLVRSSCAVYRGFRPLFPFLRLATLAAMFPSTIPFFFARCHIFWIPRGVMWNFTAIDVSSPLGNLEETFPLHPTSIVRITASRSAFVKSCRVLVIRTSVGWLGKWMQKLKRTFLWLLLWTLWCNELHFDALCTTD